MTTFFCCCLPTRLGVLLLAPLTAFLSIALSTSTIKGLADFWDDFDKIHRISLVLLTITALIVAISSIFGLIGAIIKNHTSVHAYAQLLYSLWVCFFAVGLINLIFMYKTRSNLIEACREHEDESEAWCKKAFKLSFALVVTLWSLMLLSGFYLTSIVRRYSQQLYSEGNRLSAVRPA